MDAAVADSPSRLTPPAKAIALYRLVIAAVLTFFTQYPQLQILPSHSPWLSALRSAAILALIWSFGLLLSSQIYPRAWPQWTRILVVSVDTLFVLYLFYCSGAISGPLAILPLLLLIANVYQVRGHVALIQVWVTIVAVIVINFLRQGQLGSGGVLIYSLALFAVAYLADNLVRYRERSAQEDALRAQEILDLNTLNREIIRQFDAGLLVLDRQNRVLFSNPLAQELAQLPADTNPYVLDQVQPDLGEFLRHADTIPERELSIRTTKMASGKRLLWLRSIALANTPFRLLTLRDASSLREKQREAQMAALGRLAANIAHEIRNPLSAIRHAAQLLAERSLDASGERLLQIIDRESQRLNRIVESVLEMLRPRAAHPAPIALTAWLPQILSQLRADPSLLDLQVELHGDDGLPLVSCDPEQLQQIFTNLLLNAAQHGKPPGQPLRVEILLTPMQNQRAVEIRVRDYGQGIPEENLERIFEPFFTTESLGTGLGLPLVRELLRANRADIEARNHRHGAEFVFSLPEWQLGTLL
ncbi:ATP-binding protein [Candidatus Igneacidithiobacillus taiwanensis]|uniref:sensor histidine kinase n=1 Tax=Candidatus Igneacidithiobacillus taiwanensis TaxID=1945924 RepID=UPI0028A10516|nr:ATP-binding protein [Candidatus Igneacidithiobacillus taiwanensis]